MEEMLARYAHRRLITETGCWEYDGFHAPRGGYPRVSWHGRPTSLHRLSCALGHGLPLDGPWQTRHTCENTGCWNPDHLVPGDTWDNLSDKWGVVLRDKQSEVDAMIDQGLTNSEIARRLGLNRPGVSRYRRGLTALKRG